MKHVASRLNDIEFKEHIDPMQLALLKEQNLSEEEREEVFKHLSQCKRCREVLKVASELKQEEEQIKPANNSDYIGILKPFIPFAAGVVIFLGVPQANKYFNDARVKGVLTEKNILEESIEYWEKLLKKLYKGE